MTTYFESYRKCGCVSDEERRKKDLPGYCPRHGNDRADTHRIDASKRDRDALKAESTQGAA